MYEDLIKIIIQKLRKKKSKNSYTEENIRKKLELLAHYILPSDLPKLLRHPEVFTLDQTTLEHRIEYLIDMFGRKAVATAPSLLTYDPSTTENKIKELKSIFNKSRDEIKNLILEFPKILTYNPYTIKRKIEILARELSLPYIKAVEFVYGNPRILSRSEEVIKYIIKKCGALVLEKPSLFYKSKEKIEEICK